MSARSDLRLLSGEAQQAIRERAVRAVIGGATRAALHRFERTREPYPGEADPQAAGNGPLMKLAPVPLAYAADPLRAVRYAADSARTTHGAPEAADACRYFAGLLVGALNGAGVDVLIRQGAFEPVAGLWQREPLHPRVAAVADGSFLAKEPPAIRGGGYIVDALEAALWALRFTRTFEAGVLAATNLGDDADTTAAIFGQLAGALYGVDAIPSRWRERVVMHDEIIGLADGLFELAGSIQVDAPSQVAPICQTHVPSAPRRLPTPGDSYWVYLGRLLAGPYPGASTKATAQAKLSAFLDAGVTYFVDLTEEGEGPPLHPYSSLLRQLAAERGIAATHLRMPIRDVDTPSTAQMREILAAIRRALDDDEIVYVHCWGGVGRTGTVVGCLLVEDGTRPTEVLARLVEMRVGTERARRVSPETEAQRTFVTGWTAKADAVALAEGAGARPHAAASGRDRVLRADDVPAADADWLRIAEFAQTFDGYAHFGESHRERSRVIREDYLETGHLPDSVDDLRACLYLEFRADRFSWGEDVMLSAPDADGARRIIANPDFENSPTQRYRRAILACLRELLDAPRRR